MKPSLALLAALLCACAPPAWAQAPAVTLLEPTDGAAVRRPQFRVRVSIQAQGDVQAEVVTEWPRSRHRATPMRKLDDGSWAADGITVLAPASVRVKDAAGRETKLPVRIVDESGHVRAPMMQAAGTPLPAPLQVQDVAGQPLAIPPGPGLTLVLFHSAWDDCDAELSWLEGIRREYGPRGLTIIGVASVGAQADVQAWAERLRQRQVSWQSVADPEGKVAALFDIPRRKAVGNADAGTIIYLTRDGKLADGSYVGTEQLTEENRDKEAAQYVNRALERLLPRR